ncbi:hypothetical protein HDU87_001173 [Geranomyces variabilis]|uniref:Uncharacterized protein n=1 Tax=Geranomyces variabilis TaxID=109894 RepID=A0AAD5XLF7_9FUNG|nr:hypothetical protein HDU87_001173 [Geranomyces variabilis]
MYVYDDVLWYAIAGAFVLFPLGCFLLARSRKPDDIEGSNNINVYPGYVVALVPQPPMHPPPPPAATDGGAVAYIAPPGKAFTANDEHIPISYLFGDVPAVRPVSYPYPQPGYYPPPQGPPPPLAAGPFVKDPNMPAFTTYFQGAPAPAHVPPAASPFANDPNMPAFETDMLATQSTPPERPALTTEMESASTMTPAGGPSSIAQGDGDAILTLEEALRDENHAAPADEPSGSGASSSVIP